MEEPSLTPHTLKHCGYEGYTINKSECNQHDTRTVTEQI